MVFYDVISVERRHEIDIVPTKAKRARMLLQHILTSSNLRAAFYFLEALKRDQIVLADNLIAEIRERPSEGEGDICSFSLLGYNYHHFTS